MDDAIEPLYKKEKHAKEVAVKILDMLEMADDIFKKSVQELVLIRNYVSINFNKGKFYRLWVMSILDKILYNYWRA